MSKLTISEKANMILTLEREGSVSRVPGQGRSIALQLARNQLPDLE